MGARGGAGALRMEQKDRRRPPPRGWWGSDRGSPRESRQQWGWRVWTGWDSDRTPRGPHLPISEARSVPGDTGPDGRMGASLLGVSWHLPPGAASLLQRKGPWSEWTSGRTVLPTGQG